MKKGFVILVVLLLGSCTTIPNRYLEDPSVSKNGGYIIEDENNAGFYLDVFYKSYSFAPNPDDNIQDAIDYFKKIASNKAKDRAKSLKLIKKSQLEINTTRNSIDGYYSIYVSGKVEYGPDNH